MTSDELDRATHDLIEDIASQLPGNRHLCLGQLHNVMGAYGRSGRAAPASLRRLLDELTTEVVQPRYADLSA